MTVSELQQLAPSISWTLIFGKGPNDQVMVPLSIDPNDQVMLPLSIDPTDQVMVPLCSDSVTR